MNVLQLDKTEYNILKVPEINFITFETIPLEFEDIFSNDLIRELLAKSNKRYSEIIKNMNAATTKA